MAIALFATLMILAVPAYQLFAVATGAPTDAPFGGDFNAYREAALRWLSGGSFYYPWQLTGHYEIWAGGSPVLYPPVLLLILVPFTVLPEIFWWVVPAVMISWSIWRLRPAPWSWPLMAICIAWPPTLDFAIHGNPDMWTLAFLSVGCAVAGPAVLVLLKPSLWPFALVRARCYWWMAFAAVSLPFGLLWLDWVRAVLNSDGSLIYGLVEWPMMGLPLVAWTASARSVSAREVASRRGRFLVRRSVSSMSRA